MKYLIYENGNFRRTLICSETDLKAHLLTGQVAYPVTDPPAAPPAPCVTYADQRARAYPPVGEQLDALWKGGDALAAMQARIAEVKAKFPKETP